MKGKALTALRFAAQFIAVAAIFLMLYAALWIGYYLGIPM